MKDVGAFQCVYLHRDPVDMRKSINGLSEIVALSGMGDPFSPSLFVFVGRRRDLMKILYFDRSGFALWQKRLEKERFPWPRRSDSGVIRVTPEQMKWLLEGYDIWKVRPFENLSHSCVI